MVNSFTQSHNRTDIGIPINHSQNLVESVSLRNSHIHIFDTHNSAWLYLSLFPLSDCNYQNPCNSAQTSRKCIGTRAHKSTFRFEIKLQLYIISVWIIVNIQTCLTSIGGYYSTRDQPTHFGKTIYLNEFKISQFCFFLTKSCYVVEIFCVLSYNLQF